MTVSPDGGLIYLGTETGIDILFAISGAAKATYDTGKSSKSIKVTPDGGLAVILTEDDFILLFDVGDGVPDDQRAKATQDTGTKARGIEVSPDGGSVYVTTEDIQKA